MDRAIPPSPPSDLLKAYECLKNADFASAERFLEAALHENYEHEEVLFALKSLHFWREPLLNLDSMKNLVDRGDFLMESWKRYCAFLLHVGGNFETARYAFRRAVFGLALDLYLALPDATKDQMGPDLDFRLGRARKASGDLELAQQHLERAAKSRKQDAAIMAELADTLALAGEMRMAKALFREAFFLDPRAVDLEYLESDLIRKIIENVRKLGYSGEVVAEWIPVYGEILHVLDVKRLLTQGEFTNLQSSVARLEQELLNSPRRREVLVPRLLTRYFWIVSQLQATEGDGAKLGKVLIKIKTLDPEIHARYTET